MINFFQKHYLNNARYITKKLNLNYNYVLVGLFVYYFLTMITAFCEGFAMLIFVSLLTEGKISENISEGLFLLPYFLDNLFSQNLLDSVVILILLYLTAFTIKWIIVFFEGYFASKMRQKLQEAVFENYLVSEWRNIRELRVGDSVAIISAQSANVIRYFHSLASSGFSFFYCLILSFIAFKTDFMTTIALSLICLPLIVFMRITVSIIGNLGKKLANIVSLFAADVGDRLNGIFEVKVGNNLKFHYSQGIKIQSDYTKTEVKISILHAFINTFNLSIPLVAISGLLLWLIFFNLQPNNFSFASLAGVGVLGLRLIGQLSQFNNVVTGIAKFHGNFLTVAKILDFKKQMKLKDIPENINALETEGLSFSYNKNKILIDNINLKFEIGKINLIIGESGSGKSTLSNLISGLEFPNQGKVAYIGSSGRKYVSTRFKAKIGYITQNIYIFHESLRDNLVYGKKISDKKIWSVLKDVGADTFVKNLGGLDTVTAEKGQTISGGEMRRLGIARVLLSGDDIIIFDEPTSGLDKKNKDKILEIVKVLSQKRIVILISHENLNLSKNILNIFYT